MNSALSRSCIVAVLLVSFAGCVKKPVAGLQAKPTSVELVADSERSRHFDAVNGHLELGGTLYGYVDVDGDALALAGNAQAVVLQIAAAQPQAAPFAKLDFKALFTELGLNDVKALGFSSVREASGNFRNRAFIYTPDGRHGIFAVFGGEPGRFLGSRLAPPDADYYSECEFDLSAVYDTVKAVVAKVSGPNGAAAFEKKLRDSGVQSGFSVLDVIEGLNGRGTIIIRFEPQRTLALPGPKPVNIPAFSGLVRVDSIGSAIEGALLKSGEFVAATEGTLHLYSLRKPSPAEALQFVLAVEGKTLYAATSSAFLRECLQRTAGLDANPAFAAGLFSLGPEGNGVAWVSPRFFARIRDLAAMNPQAAPEMKRVFGLYSTNLPAVSQPLLSVRTNLPDGVLFRSNWNRSLKTDVAMFTVYNPVTVGLLAAMAIPAFQKVRQNSQEKAVLNNLRMLSAAADQYYLENGVSTATYDQLVGPDKFVKQLQVVAGEDYRSLVFTQGLPLRVRLSDGRVISFPYAGPGSYRPPVKMPGSEMAPSPAAKPGNFSAPTPADPQHATIEDNLRMLDEAANQYYADHDTTTTTFEQLVGPDKYIPEMRSAAGEDYRSLLFKKGRPLRLYLKDGRVIMYPPQ